MNRSSFRSLFLIVCLLGFSIGLSARVACGDPPSPCCKMCDNTYTEWVLGIWAQYFIDEASCNNNPTCIEGYQDARDDELAIAYWNYIVCKINCHCDDVEPGGPTGLVVFEDNAAGELDCCYGCLNMYTYAMNEEAEILAAAEVSCNGNLDCIRIAIKRFEDQQEHWKAKLAICKALCPGNPCP